MTARNTFVPSLRRRLAAAIVALSVLVTWVAGPIGWAESVADLSLVGRVRLSAIYSVKARPPFAYALESGQLYVLDVRDPAAIHPVFELPFETARSRIIVAGNGLYMYGFRAPLGLVSISEPARPRWVGQFPQWGSSISGGTAVSGELLFMASFADAAGAEASPVSLQCVDIHDPLRPVRRSAIDLGVRLRSAEGVNVAAVGRRVYALVRTAVQDATRSELVTVDASDPTHPVIERRDLLPGSRRYRALAIADDLVYLLQMSPAEGLTIMRLHRDEAPTWLGDATDPDLAIGIELVPNGHQVHATFKGAAANLVTFDVADARQPRIVDKYVIDDPWAAGLGMSLVDGRLYVAGDGGPMPVFDVSGARPRRLGAWNYRGGSAAELSLRGAELYVANSGGGLLAYDVSRPSEPALTWRYDRIRKGDAFQSRVLPRVWGSHVLLGFSDLPADLLDVQGPSPRVIATIHPRQRVSAIAVDGDYAYFGSTNGPPEFDPAGAVDVGGVEVMRRTGSTVASIGRVEVPEGVIDIAARAGRLVAATRNGEILVFDTRRPQAIVMIGRAHLGAPVTASRMALEGDILYVLSRRTTTAQLSIVNVSGQTPRVVGQRGLPSGGFNTALSLDAKTLVIVAGQLMVFNIANPANPLLVTAQPVPSTDPPSVAVGASHFYVSAGEDGVFVYALPQTLRAPGSRHH